MTHALWFAFALGSLATLSQAAAGEAAAVRQREMAVAVRIELGLAELGYDPGVVDGQADAATAAALSKFLHAVGVRGDLPLDGQLARFVEAAVALQRCKRLVLLIDRRTYEERLVRVDQESRRGLDLLN